MKYFWLIVFMGYGIWNILGSICDWDSVLFQRDRRGRLWAGQIIYDKFGRDGLRIVYFIVGLIIILVSAYILFFAKP